MTHSTKCALGSSRTMVRRALLAHHRAECNRSTTERSRGMKVYKKAILPLGFKVNAVSCGIKRSGKLDLALLYSDLPAQAAAGFTTNKIQAAPIKLSQRYLRANKNFQAIIVNSGNANAFTGNLGLKDAAETAKITAKFLRLKKSSVLVNSTGIIGRRLPLLKIKKAIPLLVKGLSVSGMKRVQKAIMTTDTSSKGITVKFNLGAKTITICGIAKGAGMIAPNLATMLVFILTDAHIAQGVLAKALSLCLEDSFNCITVDGCMSTNDSVILLANGLAANVLIKGGKNFNKFSRALGIVCLELAKLVVQDAEGATKFIRIKIRGAKNFKDARKTALAIANSLLFKTAIYGENPNFGRIVCAIGASGIAVREERLKIKVSPLSRKEIDVEIALGMGSAEATIYTSDLTPEYIKINAEYN